MTYEIQQFTICEGWVNTWTIHFEDGSTAPETFPTEAEALAALAEFLTEIAEEIAAGQRDADDGYDSDEFRIVKAGAQ